MYDVISQCRIGRNFSRAAVTYDQYADVQRECGEELLRGVRGTARSIYEIGCGTGLYTRMLRQTFPQARITAVDISREMVAAARRRVEGVSFFIADAQQGAVKGSFDLVTSNATLQWLNLEPALRAWRSLLTQGGTVLCSSFGPRTYEELDLVLRQHDLGTVAAGRFQDREELNRILYALFSSVVVKEVIREKIYARLEDLLRAVKYTGSRGPGNARNGLCTAKMFQTLESAYRTRFKGIRATYQMFICEAR
jgi:malonyl-CoA O-methyltransferase